MALRYQASKSVDLSDGGSMYLLVREAPEPGIWKIEEDRNSVF